MKNKFSEKFLSNFILDLVDGVLREDELAKQFGLGDKQAAQMWKVIEQLRSDK